MFEPESTTYVAVAGTEPAAEIASGWIGDFARRWLEAWNSHRPEHILELLTDDVEYRDDAWPRTMHGHAEVREFLEALWRGMPDMSFELLSGPYVIPGQPRAAFHWRAWGTHTGVLDPPGFAPTGRRWEVDGADFHEYRDRRVSRLRVAFDMMGVSRQLGLMPPAGSRAERALALAQRSAVQAQQAIQRRRRKA
jgi:steroid delta-isomerase-like uncharacterized protein